MTAGTRALYAKARAGLATGDAGYWQAAEAMAELVELGQSYRVIAAELKCSDKTVGRYVAVWGATQGRTPRPPFAEAMAEVRGDRTGERLIPQTPERRAELAAELLKDREIYREPAVQKVVTRQANGRMRDELAADRKAAGRPTREEQQRDDRRQSVASNALFWHGVERDLRKALEQINAATAEFRRTGLPKKGSGEIVKAIRNLGKAADRFGDELTGELGRTG